MLESTPPNLPGRYPTEFVFVPLIDTCPAQRSCPDISLAGDIVVFVTFVLAVLVHIAENTPLLSARNASDHNVGCYIEKHGFRGCLSSAFVVIVIICHYLLLLCVVVVIFVVVAFVVVVVCCLQAPAAANLQLTNAQRKQWQRLHPGVISRYGWRGPNSKTLL
jgi:hypothetical protein